MVTELQLSDYPSAGSLPYYYYYVIVAAETTRLFFDYITTESLLLQLKNYFDF
jgi:hypothetical protein